MTEVWRAVEIDGPWPYDVSNVGRIRRMPTAKLLHPATGGRGYPQVLLYRDGTRRPFYVHRIVAETFIGLRSDHYVVNHKDGVKTNPHVENLEYVTYSQNTLYSGLTEDQARELRNELDRLMEQYGIGPSTLMMLASRRVWKWLM